MILAALFLAAVCAFILVAPNELTQVVLGATWVLMAAAAMVLPVLALLHII